MSRVPSQAKVSRPRSQRLLKRIGKRFELDLNDWSCTNHRFEGLGGPAWNVLAFCAPEISSLWTRTRGWKSLQRANSGRS